MYYPLEDNRKHYMFTGRRMKRDRYLNFVCIISGNKGSDVDMENDKMEKLLLFSIEQDE